METAKERQIRLEILNAYMRDPKRRPFYPLHTVYDMVLTDKGEEVHACIKWRWIKRQGTPYGVQV